MVDTVSLPHDSRRNPQPVAMGPGARLRIQWEACLPNRYATLECSCCVEACPTQALRLTAKGPELGGECLACGRCVPVCPTEALGVPGFASVPTQRTAAHRPLAIDCWRVPHSESPAGAWRVPCLGGLSSAELAELTACLAPDQCPVLLDRGICAQCPAGDPTDTESNGFPAQAVLQEVEKLLGALGLVPRAWPRRLAMPISPDRMQDPGSPLLEERVSRRGFFTGRSGAARSPARSGTANATPFDRSRTQGATPTDRPSRRQRLLAALTALAGPGVPLPNRLYPQLQASAACAGHGVCLSVCPTGALQGYTDGQGRGLRFEPAACTACNLCMRLCPEQALRLASAADQDATAAQPRRLTRHQTRQCDECGAEHLAAEVLCPACRADQDFARSAFHTFFGRQAA
jgi:ferredoxin